MCFGMIFWEVLEGLGKVWEGFGEVEGVLGRRWGASIVSCMRLGSVWERLGNVWWGLKAP